MSQKRSFIEISDDFVENNPTKRIRQQTNRFGRRESAVNYNSFFEQALEDFNIDQQLDYQPFNTCEHRLSTLNTTFEKKESIGNDLHNQIIATISILTNQMSNFNKRLGNCELKMSHQMKEDRANFKTSECDMNSDLILPIEDTRSLKELESRLKNRSFKILLVNVKPKFIFV